VFSLDEILRFLGEHPEIVDINRHCEEAYRRRWTQQSEIGLKSRYAVRRAAILGCGSIGQRHIRNLRQLGIADIAALRSRKGHFKELDPGLGVQELERWQDLIEFDPDVAVVSNPTSCHVDTALNLVPHVRGLFIEKPLSSSLEGVRTLLSEVRAHRVVSFVGYNLQFHPIVRGIKEVLGDGKLATPLLLQCQVGQWLPDWHPYEDYTQAYYARKDLGGGAALTLSHEIHLAVDLLGAPGVVSCFLSDSSALDLEVDVIADLMIRHGSGAVSQIHLDFIQQPIHRSGTVSCGRGWIDYDLVIGLATVQSSDQPDSQVIWEDAGYDQNQSYLDEMQTFLRYTREGRVKHPFDVWHATQSLAVVDAAFSSAETGCVVELPEWVRALV
jgi:predicted dehydrogenase